jgi:outer membrane receptor protein involved in Fe transport
MLPLKDFPLIGFLLLFSFCFLPLPLHSTSALAGTADGTVIAPTRTTSTVAAPAGPGNTGGATSAQTAPSEVVTQSSLAVSIKTEGNLDFGLVRAHRGTSGWVVVDPNGGINASATVALSSKCPPVPGLVRVKAPPETLVLLSLTFENGDENSGYSTSEGIAMRSLKVGRGVQALPRNGRYWELQMPQSAAQLVEVTLAVGGELHFTKFDGRHTLLTKLNIECISAEKHR